MRQRCQPCRCRGRRRTSRRSPKTSVTTRPTTCVSEPTAISQRHDAPVVAVDQGELDQQDLGDVGGGSVDVGELDLPILHLPVARVRHAGIADRRRDEGQRLALGARRAGVVSRVSPPGAAPRSNAYQSRCASRRTAPSTVSGGAVERRGLAGELVFELRVRHQVEGVGGIGHAVEVGEPCSTTRAAA